MAKTKAKIKAKTKHKKSVLARKPKPKKAAVKRIKVTGTGLYVVFSSGNNHLATSKPRARKNRLKKPRILGPTSDRLIARCLSGAHA